MAQIDYNVLLIDKAEGYEDDFKRLFSDMRENYEDNNGEACTSFSDDFVWYFDDDGPRYTDEKENTILLRFMTKFGNRDEEIASWLCEYKIAGYKYVFADEATYEMYDEWKERYIPNRPAWDTEGKRYYFSGTRLGAGASIKKITYIKDEDGYEDTEWDITDYIPNNREEANVFFMTAYGAIVDLEDYSGYKKYEFLDVGCSDEDNTGEANICDEGGFFDWLEKSPIIISQETLTAERQSSKSLTARLSFATIYLKKYKKSRFFSTIFKRLFYCFLKNPDI